MNINDSKDLEKVEQPWLSFLLSKQAELVTKYKDIEKMPKLPMAIDTHEAQTWVKDFFWRVTEELAEAIEAFEKDEEDHFLEELSDALHFYLEIFILIDYRPQYKDDAHLESMIQQITELKKRAREGRGEWSIQSDYEEIAYECIYHMGLAANCLRNKKWKQSQVFVDKEKFYSLLSTGFIHLLSLMIYAGVTTKFDLLNLYYKKFQVNQFRQESKY